MLQQYIKKCELNDKGQLVITKIGYLVAIPLGNIVAIGMSLCNDVDEFDKDRAKDIAITRALNYTLEYPIRNRETYWGETVEDTLIMFMERCNSYFKDKGIIIPKIRFLDMSK